jgi:hypothetical protein
MEAIKKNGGKLPDDYDSKPLVLNTKGLTEDDYGAEEYNNLVTKGPEVKADHYDDGTFEGGQITTTAANLELERVQIPEDD